MNRLLRRKEKTFCWSLIDELKSLAGMMHNRACCHEATSCIHHIYPSCAELQLFLLSYQLTQMTEGLYFHGCLNKQPSFYREEFPDGETVQKDSWKPAKQNLLLN